MGLDTWLTLSKAVGGIGIFMLGMIVMTQGLRALAGDAIRNALMHFTKTPLSGAITGAVSTAILQSSSATTVAAVGFVGAGLLAFSEALGIIFGANIGTTITGWMVALLGFKLKLGTIILPFILIGAILKLFFKEKKAALGLAISGFGLIFVGIDLMQEGMSVFEGVITPQNLPNDSWSGRLQLLLLGMTATLITQSSSAGVAATLTMVYTGAINFEQAAALVIGMDVGTTFTAAMAAIGGSTEVKRTGFSHVFYNFFTGIGALLLITPYTMFWEWFSPEFLTNQAEIAIVTFHTLFNVIGVILILPFTKQFAHMMEKIVPPSKQLYKQNFDLDLLEEIPLALTVVQKSLEDEFKILIKHLLFLVGDTKHGQKANLSALETVLDNTQDFIDKINIKENRNTNWERLIDLIHIMDHLQRLFDRCEEDEKKAIFLRTSHTFKLQKEAFIHTLQNLLLLLDAQVYTKISDTAKHMEQAVTDFTIQEREKITSLMANGTISIQEGTSHLEVIRWMQRTSTHIARISFHIEEATLNAGK